MGSAETKACPTARGGEAPPAAAAVAAAAAGGNVWAVSQEKKLVADAQSWGAPEDVSRLPIASAFPVVDLSTLLSGDPQAQETVVEQLRYACEAVGFYHITGWGEVVSEALLDEAFEAAECYFQRPKSAKLADRLDGAPAEVRPRGVGYLPVGSRAVPRWEKGNLVESFLLSNHAETIHGVTQAAKRTAGASTAASNARGAAAPSTAQPWPRDLGPGWQNVVLKYVSATRSLAQLLLRLLSLALRLPAEHFEELLSPPGPMWRLRMSRYPAVDPMHRQPGQYGLPPHVDTSLLTIVAGREVVSANAGGEVDSGLALHCEALGGWVRPPPRAGALLVNTGEMLSRITNDVWPSARHYVANPRLGSEARRSLAFFLAPNPGVPMHVAPTCITKERPARYKPTTWIEGFGQSRGGLLAPLAAA